MDAIKQFFSQLFTDLNTADSWTVLSMLLGAFLIGLITNYFLNRSKVASLEAALEKNIRDQEHLRNQLSSLQEQHALQEADLKKANLELIDKRKNLEATDAEKRTLSSRLNATLLDLDKSKEEFQETTNRIEDLQDQILGLRTKNTQLNSELEQGISTGQFATSQGNAEAIKKYEQRIVDLTAENQLLKNSIDELKANAESASADSALIVDASLRIEQLEEENEGLRSRLMSLQPSAMPSNVEALEIKIAELEGEKEKLEDYYAEITQLEAGNEVLNTTIARLMEENEQLKEAMEELPQYESGNEALQIGMQTLLIENEDLHTRAAEIIQYESGNDILNSTITGLIEQNAFLEKELENSQSNKIEWAVGESSILEDQEVEEIDVEAAKAKFRAAIGNQIARAGTDERDDLKQINGIGPFIEEKLNDLGIFTFEQISQLDEELTEVLTTAIEFFPGRIERDDWVGQADRLFYTKGSAPQEMGSVSKIVTRRYATATEKIEVSAIAATPSETPSPATARSASIKPDDLKKIEGIGPKISQILNNAGILTFSALATTPVERLNEILAAAGNRYKMHNPTTWPQQAELAAAGNWDKLKELQDYLDGGRDVAKG